MIQLVGKKVYRVKTKATQWFIVAKTMAEAEFKFTLPPITGKMADIVTIDLVNGETYE